MEVRQIEPIDRAELRATIQKWIDAHTDVDDTDGVGLLEDVLWEINAQPTLTPPNEWISVEERLPEPGDLIVYADNTVWGYQYGICRVCGKEKAFDYWIPLQDPPNNRPPEGEEDTK